MFVIAVAFVPVGNGAWDERKGEKCGQEHGAMKGKIQGDMLAHSN